MARQVVNRGSAANDGTGDNLRDGAGKINDNFNELYTAFGDGSTLTAGTFVTDTGTHTLENKSISLTDNTITGTTTEFNTALTDNDFATLAGSEILTNKTIDTATNTISNLTNSNLSGSAAITNANLSNSSITLRDSTSTTDAVALGETLSILGTSNEIDVTVGSNTVTVGLPNDVTIGNNLIVTNNLTVNGTTTTINSTTLTVDDKNIEMGSVDTPDDTTANGGGITLKGATDKTISWSSATGYWTSNQDFNVASGKRYFINGTDIKDVSETLTSKTISGSSNTLSDIANSSLTNSSVTLGATTINLGDTAGSATNFNLSGTSSLSGSGTINTTGSGNRLRFNVAAADASALASAISPTTYEGMFAYNTTENYPYVADTAGWTRILTENDGVGDLSNVTLAGISNGEALIWNSGNGRFEPGAAGGAVSLTYTNGTFTGDGSTTTITIDSGHTVNDVLVSVNGFLLVPTTDYTISSTTLTFTTAPAASAEISVRYLPTSGTTYTNDTATGDGSTTAFTIDSSRSVEDVIATVNGLILVPTVDYSISGTTLTFTTAPAASAEISFRYLTLGV